MLYLNAGNSNFCLYILNVGKASSSNVSIVFDISTINLLYNRTSNVSYYIEKKLVYRELIQ
jgi:hypothetical protein